MAIRAGCAAGLEGDFTGHRTTDRRLGGGTGQGVFASGLDWATGVPIILCYSRLCTFPSRILLTRPITSVPAAADLSPIASSGGV